MEYKRKSKKKQIGMNHRYIDNHLPRLLKKIVFETSKYNKLNAYENCMRVECIRCNKEKRKNYLKITELRRIMRNKRNRLKIILFLSVLFLSSRLFSLNIQVKITS